MTISISDTAEDLIRAQALALGFDLCRFTVIEPAWPAAERLEEFVAAGRHGEMAWLADSVERRAHPKAMWADARAAIVLGMNYGPDHDPLAILAERDQGAISVYAQGDDYHELIKTRLKALARWLQTRFGGDLKVFVDTAPLLEKPLAEQAGLGWQGKHTNLVSREFGSWLFLGSILTTLGLAPDAPEPQSCGTCHACMDICPTECITFTANGDEADLRQRTKQPAHNLEQPLLVSGELKTGRVMVKDEDVCLHCGLCAERCPTSAWDMEKYFYSVSKAGCG